MTQTTTYVNACDTSIWLDNLAGTPIDVSGSSNQISAEFNQVVGELSTFQTRWPVRMTCRKDATFTLGIVYSGASDEALDIVKLWFFAAAPGLRTLTFYHPDKNVGSDKYSGEVILESWSIPASADEAGPIAVNAVLRPSGAWTCVVNAT
jgi:hypothetical protein